MSRLLVAEHDPRIASLAAKGLRADGHAVVVADDAELAVLLADADDVDLVVLGLGRSGLPGGSAFETLCRRGGVPVVLLTEDDTPAQRAAALAAGASAYLTKPFAIKTLRAIVREELAADQAGAA